MALSPQNPLISGYNVPKAPLPQVSPQEWEYVQQLKRTGYDPNQLQQVQQQMQQIVSDPYVEFENEFSRCSPTIQNKILNDSEFKAAMAECDKQIQHAIEQIIRPQVLQTKEGSMSFERLLATFRNIRDKFSEEETQNLAKIQQLMQDDVIQKRLLELSKAEGVNNNDK